MKVSVGLNYHVGLSLEYCVLTKFVSFSFKLTSVQ